MDMTSITIGEIRILIIFVYSVCSSWFLLFHMQVFIQEDGQYFVKEDFSLLENVEYEKRVKQVEGLVDKIEWKDIDSDDLTRFL